MVTEHSWCSSFRDVRSARSYSTVIFSCSRLRNLNQLTFCNKIMSCIVRLWRASQLLSMIYSWWQDYTFSVLVPYSFKILLYNASKSHHTTLMHVVWNRVHCSHWLDESKINKCNLKSKCCPHHWLSLLTIGWVLPLKFVILQHVDWNLLRY